MSAGVFTNDLRFTFVDKTAGEVGEGTAFPLLVTQDQLAEIMYRVRDSVFSGSITETYNNGIDPPSLITLGISGSPATNLVEFTSVVDGPGATVDWFVQRGYSTANAVGWEAYFKEPYDIDTSFPMPLFSEAYDADDERAMWIPNSSGIGFNGAGYPSSTFNDDTPINDFVTGFSHCFLGAWNNGNDFTYSGYKAYHNLGYSDDFPAAAYLAFGSQVAWVDENESGNPIDPLNKLYISLQFEIFGTFYTQELWSTSYSAISGNAFPMGVYFEIELQTGDVITCPLYSNKPYPDAAYTYSGAIRVKATEWWPYAKDSPAVPVWDAGTGARL